MDNVIFGYKPVGDVPFVGCHRPIVDKPRKVVVRAPSREPALREVLPIHRMARGVFQLLVFGRRASCDG